MWGARKELRVCGRVLYSQRSQRTPYGCACTNLKRIPNSIPSILCSPGRPGLTLLTAYRDSRRGAAQRGARELSRHTYQGRSRAEKATPALLPGRRGRACAQRRKILPASDIQTALSLSQPPRAIDVPFAGKVRRGAEACTDCDMECARAPNNPSGPPRCVAWNPKGLRRAPRMP